MFLKKIGLKIIFTHWNFRKCDMVKHELQATSYELKALKHDLKFKSASSNPWVTSSNLRVTTSSPRIIKLMKTQVNSLKISSFPKIINPKLFGWVSKHQLWKKRPKFSTEKSPRFFFPIFNTKLYAVPFNYYCQALKVPPHRINGGLLDNGCSSVPLASA